MSACLTEVHVVVSVVSSGPTPSHTLQYRIFRKLTCEVLQCRIKDSNVFKRNEYKSSIFFNYCHKSSLPVILSSLSSHGKSLTILFVKFVAMLFANYLQEIAKD